VRFASTAPAASTGGVSWLHSFPCSSVFRELLIRVVIRDGLMPRMIGRLAVPLRGCTRRRPEGRARRRRGRRLRRRRRDLSPPHQAPSIAQLNRAGDRLAYQHRAPGGRQVTLPRHLQVPRVVANHPVVGQHPRVLELEHAIERSVLMATGPTVAPGDLGLRRAQDGAQSLENMGLEDVEAFLIRKAVSRYGSVTDAAKALGLSRSALYRRLERYGIEP